MEFEWDEAKNALNIRKHGIDFNDVIDMFHHPMLIHCDESRVEPRWIGIGWLTSLIGVVVYTERKGNTLRR